MKFLNLVFILLSLNSVAFAGSESHAVRLDRTDVMNTVSEKYSELEASGTITSSAKIFLADRTVIVPFPSKDLFWADANKQTLERIDAGSLIVFSKTMKTPDQVGSCEVRKSITEKHEINEWTAFQVVGLKSVHMRKNEYQEYKRLLGMFFNHQNVMILESNSGMAFVVCPFNVSTVGEFNERSQDVYLLPVN